MAPAQTDAASPSPRRRPVRDFGSHLAKMPRWHKVVLLLALALAILGIVGQTKTRTSAPESPTASSTPGNSRGFVSSNSDQGSSPAPAPAPTFSNKLSRYATHVGLLFMAGFLLGYAFRAFLKTTAMIAFAAIAILTALSYFHILNVDFSVATENQIKSESSWITDQAGRLKDSLLAHFHGSLSAAAGMFVGFRRK